MITPQPLLTGPAALGLRYWRIMFVVGLIMQYGCTHFPRATLSTPQHPVDKLLHATAGAVVTALLWQTRWVATRTACVLTALAWFVFDEATQAIPGLGRSAELSDYCADALGILMAGMVLAANRPVPGAVANLIERRKRVLGLMLVSKVTNWLHLGTGTVLGIGAGACFAFYVDSLVPRVSDPPQAIVMGAVFGGFAGFYLMREFGMRTLLRRVIVEQPCLACGAPGTDSGPCKSCGQPRHPLAWMQFALLEGSRELRICAPVVLQGVGAFVLLAGGVIYGATLLNSEFEFVRRTTLWYDHELPKDLRRVIDIAAICLAGSWTYRRCRVRVARALDGDSGARCLSCGYDLHATAAEDGTGVCTECGRPFVRAASVATA